MSTARDMLDDVTSGTTVTFIEGTEGARVAVLGGNVFEKNGLVAVDSEIGIIHFECDHDVQYTTT